MFKKGDPETKRAGGKGGLAVKAKYGPKFFSIIGGKGSRVRWAKVQAIVLASSPVVETPEKQEN